MSAPFRLVAFDHVVVRVRDMAAMMRFYTEALGCELVWQRDELGLVHLRAGASFIDLLDVAGPLGGGGGTAEGTKGRNMDHVCLTIAPFDEAAIRAHLDAWGVTAGEVATRFGAQGPGPSLYLSDPEGNGVELKAAAEG